jgi:hypothetical protein
MSARTESATQQVQQLAQLDERDVRALTEPMDVYVDDPATADGDHEVAVYNEGERRLVNVDVGFCDCPDAHYRQAHCKHLRRVEFALGRRAVPAGIRTEALDDGLRRRLQEADQL